MTSTDASHWSELPLDGVNAYQETADPDPDGDQSAVRVRLLIKMPAAGPRLLLRLRITTH